MSRGALRSSGSGAGLFIAGRSTALKGMERIVPDLLTNLQSMIPAFNVTSPVGAEIVDQANGRYRGETVAPSSESSKLTDAAEEMGMSVATRADKKSLGQRQVRQGQGADLQALARIAEYYDKLPNMPSAEQIKALVDKLAQFLEATSGDKSGGASGFSKDDVLAALQDFDGDVTHQYAALEIAREYFEASGAPAAFQTVLDEARADYERGDLGRDVRAGFAAAAMANALGPTLETDPAALRDAYRAMLRETPNYGDLFGILSGFDVLKSLPEVVDAFMTAAARDLASTGPSTDERFLHGLLTELGKLKRVQTTLDQAQDLVRSVARLLPPTDRSGLDAVALAGRALEFSAKSVVSVADARALLGALTTASFASQVALANGLRGLHAEMPDEIMPSPQARLQQASTLMLLLDDLTAAEQDEYDAIDAAQSKSPATGAKA